MDLHDMKRTKEEKKEYGSESTVRPSSPDVEEYPYGLSISLEKESLEKLGLDVDDFNLDSKVDIICLAKVESLHESSSKNNSSSSVSLQICKMAMRVQPNENKVTLKDVIAAVKGGD